MGEWHKVGKKPWSPCDDCQAGYCSYSSKYEGGEWWVKTEDCHETCQRYKDWLAGKLTGKSKKDDGVIIECGNIRLHHHPMT